MLKTPATLHFEVTNACNNNCHHCYASSWLKKKSANIKIDPLDVAKAIVDNNVFDIVITGGEPLTLETDKLIKIMDFFNKTNTKFSLNTNARLLTENACQFLKNYNLKGVLVSLHSWKDSLHDTLVGIDGAAKETKKGIKTALKNGLRVTVNQVVCNENIHTMLETCLELEKLGIHGISFTRLISPLDVDYKIDVIKAKDFIDEYEKCLAKVIIPCKSLIPIPYCADIRVKDLGEKLSCTGGISSVAVSSNGDVRFCPQDSSVWGNLMHDDLSLIWDRIVQWRRETNTSKECHDCTFLPDCKGGCRVASKTYSGDYFALDPWANGPVTDYERRVIYSPFNPGSMHMIMPNIRYRQESDEYILYWQNKFIKVNEDGIQLLQILPNRFIPQQILESSVDNYEILIAFLEDLYKSGIIVELVKRQRIWER